MVYGPEHYLNHLKFIYRKGQVQGQTKARLYAEVTFTVDEHCKNDPTPKRYTVLKFNMARVEEEGYSEVLRSGSEGTGMPIKPYLTKVVVSIKLIYLDGPLEVITVNEPKPNPEEIPQKLGVSKSICKFALFYPAYFNQLC